MFVSSGNTVQVTGGSPLEGDSNLDSMDLDGYNGTSNRWVCELN